MPNYSPEEQRNIDAVNRMFRSGEQRMEPFDVSSLFADDAVWWNGLPLIPGAVGQTEHKGIDAIRNIRTVRWTIRDGRVYDAPTLWKSVRFQP